LIQSFKQKAATSDAYETASYIVRRSGIAELLRSDPTPEGQARVENVNALLDGIKEFVEDDELDEGEEMMDKTMSAFLQTISLMTDADNDTEEQDVVTLMSVHAAKGLEYRSVYVTGLEENLFPSYMSLSSPEQIDEERRLFYVAITRAENYLTLSYAQSRYQYGQMRYNDPSRFLEEIGEGNFDSIISISKKPEFPQPKILGNFKKLGAAKAPAISPPSGDFQPSSPEKIKAGMKVLHQKFGTGEVKSVDERMVASIHFDQLQDNKEKRIMLKYAKIQILEN